MRDRFVRLTVWDPSRFVDASTRVRNGEADAIAIPSLEQLAPDLIVQECMLDEARRLGVPIVSEGDDAGELLQPSDPVRALVRRAVVELPRFQQEMRSVRARLRQTRASARFDRSVALLAELETPGQHGEWIAPRLQRRAARAPYHRIAALIRLRRRPV